MSIIKNTVKDHIRALRQGDYSAQELCDALFDEIEKTDPDYCAYLHTDKDYAKKSAKKADEMLKGQDAPLLCGIPFGAKDNVCTKDIPTTAGSLFLKGYIPPYSATVIERLKKKGAVLLGKTNMDEFGMGSSTANSAYKITKNSVDNTRSPGGSSGGSAAAVSLGIAPFALGSDTGGSIRQPAAFCGCVGLCPTYGALSRYGLIAFASSLDRIGITAKTCTDAAIVFSSMLGKDGKDATSIEHSISPSPVVDVKGIKIGLCKELFSDAVSDEIKNSVLSAAEIYKSMGAEIVEVSIPSLSLATEAYYVISSAEASSNLARYDGVRFGNRVSTDPSSTDSFYKANRSACLGDEVKRRIMLGTFVLSADSYENYYKKALAVRELIKSEYKKAFKKSHIILSPTTTAVAPSLMQKALSPAEIYAEDLCTVSQSLAGIPAISIPCGTDGQGMPVGMQLCGPALSEELLLGAGISFEEVQK